MAGIDFDKLKNIVDDKFETVRVLDNDGNVVNKDLFHYLRKWFGLVS